MTEYLKQEKKKKQLIVCNSHDFYYGTFSMAPPLGHHRHFYSKRPECSSR